MECPKCHFVHPDQTTECLSCGIVFEKYARRQDALHHAPPQVFADPVDSPASEPGGMEFRLRLLALPVALLVAWLLVHSGLQFLVRTFLSMWVHEAGHAVTAWLCGFGAFPGPWRTPVSEERIVAVTVVVAAALVAGCIQAWRTERWTLVAGGVVTLLAQLVCTRLSISQANALVVFGGDAGCLVLGSLLMATFYADREGAIFRGGLRWGFLVIGAAGFMDGFSTWWGARHDPSLIPFGENEGVGLSDPTRLTDEYGWAVWDMINRYVWLGVACLFMLAVLYAVGLVKARTAGTARTAGRAVADEA